MLVEIASVTTDIYKLMILSSAVQVQKRILLMIDCILMLGIVGVLMSMNLPMPVK